MPTCWNCGQHLAYFCRDCKQRLKPGDTKCTFCHKVIAICPVPVSGPTLTVGTCAPKGVAVTPQPPPQQPPPPRLPPPERPTGDWTLGEILFFIEGLVDPTTFTVLLELLEKYPALGDMSVNDVAEVVKQLAKTLDDGVVLVPPTIERLTSGVSHRVTPSEAVVVSSFLNMLNMP